MKKWIARSLLTTMMISPLAQAETTGFSAGVQGGVYGFGANFKGKFSDYLGVKVGYDTHTYKDIEVEEEDVTYNFDVQTKATLATADIHPYANSFALRVGAIINDSNMIGDIKPKSVSDTIKFEFNGTPYEYSVDELGSIQTLTDFDPVAPYVGIGWDTSWNKESGFGFTFDLGASRQGAARVSYKLQYGTALDFDQQIDIAIAEETKGIPESPQKDAKIAEIKERVTADIASKRAEIETNIKTELDKEMDSLQKELNKYDWIPYIAIGVNYKF